MDTWGKVHREGVRYPRASRREGQGGGREARRRGERRERGRRRRGRRRNRRGGIGGRSGGRWKGFRTVGRKHYWHCPEPSTFGLCTGLSTVPGHCTVRGEEEKGRGQEGRREEGRGEEGSRRVEEGSTAT